jgi:hypothetical protein
VLAERDPWGELDAHLDDLASGVAEIVPLEVGPFDARLLGWRRGQHEAASDDQCRYSRDMYRFHMTLRFLSSRPPGHRRRA